MKNTYLLILFLLGANDLLFAQCTIPVNASVDLPVICPGQQIKLSANAVPVSCGPSVKCNGSSNLSQIGSGNTAQTGSQLQPPSLLGNFTKSGRNQMLYTAAELFSGLGGPCVLTNLAFNLQIFNSNSVLSNFSIKMACTSASSLTTWENNLTTVYTSATPFMPQTGWLNSFSLTTSFAWDGVSNLIVDVCWYNPVTFGSQNNKAECTNTGFTSYLYIMGNIDYCGTAVVPALSSLRPNVKFNYCVPDINDYTVVWTPSIGINAVTIPDTSVTSANPVTSTNYIISVSDTSGCTGTDTVNVLVDNSRVSAGVDISSCPNHNNTLKASVIGSVIPGPAAFSWKILGGANLGNTDSIVVSPSVSTSYVVTMNGGACLHLDTVRVNIVNLPVVTTVINVTCNGANNGKVKAVGNGSAPYTYAWSANAGTGNVDSAKNLIPGIYSVTVTDALGCSGSATAVVTEPTALTLTQSITNIYCNGGNNGQIIVYPVGGSGSGYNFSWSNGLPNNDTVSNLTFGAYSVTVTDGNGCPKVSNLNITQPTALIFNAAQKKNIACFNGNDGYITVSVSGGSGGYTYTWSHDAQLHQPNAGSLAAGNYLVTVTDVNGCSLSTSYALIQPATAVTFNPPTVVNTTCFGSANGSITARPTGGSLPYSYAWNTTPSQLTQTATGLSAQAYVVTVTDDSLCIATTSITVNSPPQILISGAATDALCNGSSDGSIDVTVTNGVSPLGYAWNYNAAITEDLSSLPAGSYTITVTDNTSCSQSASFTVGQPVALSLNPSTITNVSCFNGSNGSITANPSGGTSPYGYTWNPNSGASQTINGLAANTYFLTVVDFHNCTVAASYPVTQPATALSFGAATVAPVLCNGLATGSIILNVSGGTGVDSFSWSHNVLLNNTAASNLSANTYTTTVTDANGCSISTSNIINEPTAITFGTPNITDVSCAGLADGSGEVTPSGGVGTYTFTWNGISGSNPQTGLAANSYNVVVTDANLCTVATTVLIAEPAALSVNLTPHDVRCFQGNDGSVDAVVSGGNSPYAYAWSVAQTTSTITGLTKGGYSVTVTDAHNCNTSAATVVNEPSALQVTATSTQVTCSGSIDGTITAVATGGSPGFSYTLLQNAVALQTNSTGLFTALNTGNYSIAVTDANSCPATTPVFIPAPVGDVYSYTIDSTSCFGSSYTDGAIHVSGGPLQNTPFAYSIDNGNPNSSGDFYNLSAGEHVVVGTNYWGCSTQLTIVVPEPENGVVDVFPHDTVLQLGESIRLITTFSPFPASSIVSYNWTPGVALNCVDCADPLVTPYSRETRYSLTVTYNGQCVATTGLTILVEDTLPVFIPNSFSPNGDGNNEEFKVFGKGIKFIDLKIFNRWGEKVFETNNQLEGWDGTFEGEMQTASVFSYWVKITYLDDKKIERKGSVTLIR